jgi:formylglycine-generating enzyme required for sulfatase activity
MLIFLALTIVAAFFQLVIFFNTVSAGERPKETFTNSLGMTFIFIEPGTFIMGSGPNYIKRGNYFFRPRKVTIDKPFYMGITPVTQAQWMALIEENFSFYEGNNRPVDSVSYFDTQDFIKALNQREGTNNIYRLPTDVEWEYAARAGSDKNYFYGDNYLELDEYAWYCDTSDHNETQNVATKKPNTWGLYDMYGNVYEWVDTPKKYLIVNSYKENPTFVDEYRGLIRGGCSASGEWECQSAFKTTMEHSLKIEMVGFRLVKDIEF